MKPTNLVGANLGEIETLISGLGEPRFRARQIYAGIYRRRLRSWDDFTDLAKRFRENLKEGFAIEYPYPERTFLSKDGTRRYLFELSPGQKVESVFIPEERRDTFCLSTQVGCAVESAFSASPGSYLCGAICRPEKSWVRSSHSRRTEGRPPNG